MRRNEKFLVQDFVRDLMEQKKMTTAEVSAACGFESVATFERTIESEQRFPLDKVHRLAESLQCERRHLWMLALTDWFGEEFAHFLADALQSSELTSGERTWLECLRELYPAGAPPVTSALRNRLRKYVCMPC